MTFFAQIPSVTTTFHRNNSAKCQYQTLVSLNSNNGTSWRKSDALMCKQEGFRSYSRTFAGCVVIIPSWTQPGSKQYYALNVRVALRGTKTHFECQHKGKFRMKTNCIVNNRHHASFFRVVSLTSWCSREIISDEMTIYHVVSLILFKLVTRSRQPPDEK